MRSNLLICLLLMGISGFVGGGLSAQTVIKPLPATAKAEPGLEVAVGWKWWVEPSAGKPWGMPLPDALKPKDGTGGTHDPASRPGTYEVRKGDALVKIARKFDMTADQLKQFNGLKDDLISVGQVLRIPTLGDLLLMAPPVALPVRDPESKKGASGVKKGREPVVFERLDSDQDGIVLEESDYVRIQAFLDRQMFSVGMIDGKGGPMFQKVCELYQSSHPDAADLAMLKAQAETSLKEPYISYVLRADDFKFIRLSKDEPVAAPTTGKKATKSSKAPKAAPTVPPVTIEQLAAEEFMAYASAWEFVAERYHCDEEFLQHINPQIKGKPVVGTEFQVPNVVPFEIENALNQPLRPAVDSQKPVTVAVVGVSWMEISRSGELVAVMPMATARPGLRGRDLWTLLGSIPQPRMATKQEPRDPAKTKPAVAGDGGADPATAPPPSSEMFLSCGPNNPVGVLWINLAKEGSTDPLPYGLHGTSMPGKMRSQQGIGGFRMTNWDIVRAARLIPEGTELQWKVQ